MTAQLSEASRVALGPPTRDAINAAGGDLVKARHALGIGKTALHQRIAQCTLAGIPLRAWVDLRWPQRGGHRATKVLRVDTEHGAILSYFGPIRVYVLAAHDGAGDGEHVNRVPAVGVVRARVVCQVCKEKRTT